MQKFSPISGYKVNEDKSVFMGLNIDLSFTIVLQQKYKGNWVDKVKYLGINITKDYSDLLEFNLIPIIESIHQQLLPRMRLKVS